MEESNLSFSKDHVWVDFNGEEHSTIGITNYAQEQLGDILFVELPEVGKTIRAGEVLAVLESVKSASEVYMPFEGVVVEVNSELVDNPEKINQSPYEEGWLVKVSPIKNEIESNLFTFEEYQEYLKTL